MNYFKIIIVLSVLLLSCKPKTETVSIVSLLPRESIKSLVDSFIQVNGTSDSIYEIYIDKRTPWVYDVVIYSGNYSLQENPQAVAITKISDVTFYIYTGIEHYFSTLTDSSFIDEGPANRGAPAGNYWLIQDDGKSRTVKEMYPGVPFYNLPSTMQLDSLVLKDKVL